MAKYFLEKTDEGDYIERSTGRRYKDAEDFLEKNKIPKPEPPLTTLSIVMYGVHKCSGSCVYCSAATPQGYKDNHKKNNFKIEPEKIDERVIDFFKKSQGIDITKNHNFKLQIDIWGSNPLSNFKEFKQTVEYCKTLNRFFCQVILCTSGNGLELASDEVVDYIIKNDIHYQLSHDGLGQWQRTGDIDPLYWGLTKENFLKILRLGLVRNINCTLSERNWSFYENYHYWEKYFEENDIKVKPIVKLNKVAAGTKPVNKVWTGKDNPQIKHGEIIGNQQITENADKYFAEWKKMYFDQSVPAIYKSYFNTQLDGFKHLNGNMKNNQSCWKFQHGYQDWNFAIDTLGYYCECNLVDHDNHCNGRGKDMPEECSHCKYNDTTECLCCDTEDYERPKCTFRKKQCNLLTELKWGKFSLVDIRTNKILGRSNSLEGLGFVEVPVEEKAETNNI